MPPFPSGKARPGDARLTWNLTLEVVKCGATATKLAGAKIAEGVTDLGLTDAAGRFTATLDDFDTLPIFKVSMTDYVAGNFRFDKGLHAGTIQTVCLENPATIPDGQDPNVPGESGGQEFDGGGCFIVTATTGSATSDEVMALRALREEIRGRSRIAGRLIDAIYDDYARFSPPIAQALVASAAERQAVLTHVVRPLFAWYRLAAALALHPDDAGAHRQAMAALTEARPGRGDRLVLGLLIGLRAGVAPPFVPRLLRDLAPRIPDYRFAGWAILDPLIRIRRGAGRPCDVPAEIADWLAAVPLDLLPPPCAACGLVADLEAIADFLAFAPERRAGLGDRLRAAWPEAGAALARTRLAAPTMGLRP